MLHSSIGTSVQWAYVDKMEDRTEDRMEDGMETEEEWTEWYNG